MNPPSEETLEKAWASTIQRQLEGVLSGEIRELHRIPALFAALHYVRPIADTDAPWLVIPWEEERGADFGPTVGALARAIVRLRWKDWGDDQERLNLRAWALAHSPPLSLEEARVALMKRGLLITASRRIQPQHIRLGTRWLKGSDGKRALVRPFLDLTARDFIAWTLQDAVSQARAILAGHRIVPIDAGRVPGWAVRDPPSDPDDAEPWDESNLLAFSTGLPSLASGALEVLITREAKQEASIEVRNRLADMPEKRRQVLETILDCYEEGVPVREILGEVARRCGISRANLRKHIERARRG